MPHEDYYVLFSEEVCTRNYHVQDIWKILYLFLAAMGYNLRPRMMSLVLTLVTMGLISETSGKYNNIYIC